MKLFPQITTSRLILRKIKLSDVPALIKYAGNKKISDQILNIPHPYTEEDAVARMNFVYQGFKAKERYVFAITLQPHDELIGEIGIHLDATNNSAQFGYWVAEPHWGKGIATEAVAAILNFGFETLCLNKIYATHYPDNPASGKVMANNNMIKEAELRDHYRIDGIYKSVIQYRLTQEEFKALKA